MSSESSNDLRRLLRRADALSDEAKHLRDEASRLHKDLEEPAPEELSRAGRGNDAEAFELRSIWREARRSRRR